MQSGKEPISGNECTSSCRGHVTARDKLVRQSLTRSRAADQSRHRSKQRDMIGRRQEILATSQSLGSFLGYRLLQIEIVLST